MSNSKVTVVADDNGNVIRQSKNPEIGYVRVTQDAVSYSANGWVQRKTRSALILGNIDDLKELKFKKGQTLDGKIVVKESTEPFNSEDPDRDLKIAGSTGIICCTADGEPIYRTTFYDATGLQVDIMIPHANGDAIRTANSEGAGAEAIAEDEFPEEAVEPEVEPEVENEVEETVSEIEEDEIEEDSFEL
jgi:hypothetical protein